ncbi:hypothetical protein NX772_02725 [Mesomycoplasma molare]|uniref:Uncharacterized protein n=1 Tax=Mesomycoplasma molare TaxID=171288 RepID=A0ABY5TY87_9BACT|nr:hypothetical protein [Mesomycoplasma molare]UWD33999.1 hypothetical protein NX772_02725 [Mesomycoplasma molare]
MSKKIGNKKGLVLGAVLGASVGATGAISPLLWNNQTKKAETVKVVDFETSNVGLNGATIKFRLDLENLDKRTEKEIKSKEKINVNIIDANTSIILDTLEAIKNEKDEYTLDINSLEPGKIYNLQVIDLGLENLTFDLNANSGFIITKPELTSLEYILDKRHASFEFIFSDEEKILLGKDIIVSFKEEGSLDGDIKRLKGKVVSIPSKGNDVIAKEKIGFIASTKNDLIDESGEYLKEDSQKELKRNTIYKIESILIDNENISFSSSIDLDFKTTIPQTIVSELKQKEQTKSSSSGALILKNLDSDVLDKRVNITFAEITKNENGDITGYKNIKTVSDKRIEQNDEKSYKIDLNLEDLNLKCKLKCTSSFYYKNIVLQFIIFYTPCLLLKEWRGISPFF